MSSGKGCVSYFKVDIDGPGETKTIDVFGNSLLQLEAASATEGVDLTVT
jgi:hypothetical protein